MDRRDEMPMGLGFGLSMNEAAMSRFATMKDDEKRQVIEAARGVQTKEQMQGLIDSIADLELIKGLQ